MHLSLLPKLYFLGNNDIKRQCHETFCRGNLQPFHGNTVILCVLQDIFSFGNLALARNLPYHVHFSDHLVSRIKAPILAPSPGPILRPLGLCTAKPHFAAILHHSIVQSQTSRVWKKAFGLESFDTSCKF